MEDLRKARLREIPPVNEVLFHPGIAALQEEIPHLRVTEAVQEVLASVRQQILESGDIEFLSRPLEVDFLAAQVREKATREHAYHLRRVINATGVVLHTNCGRSVLAGEVVDFVSGIAQGYSNLELDLGSGERGSRYSHVEDLLCKLTGAEAGMVVNNNAAAVLLVMRALASGREVIVSRGELVEVGGAFRIPEVLKAGGANLIEVGTTNKTRLKDYASAITDNTAVLLKVHTSNFRVVGFTEQVGSGELVELGSSLGIPVVEDLGSGTLVDLSQWGIPYEPTVPEAIKSGVDVVAFSGDKLLGGPQAGIIVGKRSYIDRLKKDQLTRALRIDKLTLAALEATLRLYLEKREQEIPTLALLSLSANELSARADALAASIRLAAGTKILADVEQGYSLAGGGSLPTANLPAYLVSVKPGLGTVSELEEFLRQAETPVLARVQKDRLLLDVRTLLPGDSQAIARVFHTWAQQDKEY